MSLNYFQGTKESPYHISIGGIVRNSDGAVCCHYFKTVSRPSIGTLDNLYLLMRETLEPNESIEQCLSRGLMEEFGVEAVLQSYVGSIVSRFNRNGISIEKTTLYFSCDLVSFDPARRKQNDPEAVSEIIWLPKEELIPKMNEQGIRLGWEDMDESSILERIA